MILYSWWSECWANEWSNLNDWPNDNGWQGHEYENVKPNIEFMKRNIIFPPKQAFVSYGSYESAFLWHKTYKFKVHIHYLIIPVVYLTCYLNSIFKVLM